MKRNIVIQKLVNEGFSEKTLVNFTDKQLVSLATRLLSEEDVMISKKDPQLQQKVTSAKKLNKTIETYEEKKGTKKKSKSEVKEDSWDSKKVAKKFKEIGKSVKRNTPLKNLDNIDDSQTGNTSDDFYKKLSKAKYNPEKGELELPNDINESKKKPKIGQKAKLALTLKKLKEHSDEQEWVNKLVENNYHSMTTKNEIMELIQTKLNEAETMVPMPKKAKIGHNGIPEFMSYDSIKGSEPSVAPSKPTTKPADPTTKPGTRPKPKTPYQPGPGTNPKPKAISEKKLNEN